jgi:hypothetical protein
MKAYTYMDKGRFELVEKPEPQTPSGILRLRIESITFEGL